MRQEGNPALLTDTTALPQVESDSDGGAYDWELGRETLFAILERRPGWQRGSGNWRFTPSTPPGADSEAWHPTEACEPTCIDDCAEVFPPSVRFYIIEEAGDPPRLRTAAEITGIEHPPLDGEVFSISFDSIEDIIEALDEIESWRWPARLPARSLRDRPGIDGIHWDPGPPDDLGTVAAALAERVGWRRHDETFDGRSLAQLWPGWAYLPARAPLTRIWTDHHNGTGYRVWAPVNSYLHVHFPDALSLLGALDAIESWRRDRLPRWVERGYWKGAPLCPRCQAPATEECNLVGNGPICTIHAERLTETTLAPFPGPGRRTPRPGQLPVGRTRRKPRR